MSFFDDELSRLPLPEPEPEPEIRPAWEGPPAGVLPALLPLRAVLVRTDQMLVVVHDFRAYPTGLLFSIGLRNRRPYDRDLQQNLLLDPRHWLASRRHQRTLRFGIEFADGRRWSSLTQSVTDTEAEPGVPILWTQGGGGGDGAYEMRYWLWPLPPPGDLTFHLEWPGCGIGPTSAAVSGQAIVHAAATAEVIWPD